MNTFTSPTDDHETNLRIHGTPALARVVRELHVDMGIVATPAAVAQQTVRELEIAGVEAILNFAPTEVHAGSAVAVRTMDVAFELEALSCARSSAHAEATA